MGEMLLDESYKNALSELLFQLADDDFFISYRGSEWLGLAPHIEEDVAFSSISQDCMGHATMFYTLLEDLGYGDANELAHLRAANERRNSIVAERENGEGNYKEAPRYDWAYAVVRNFYYSLAKKIKINSLCNSAYKPLAEIATKVNMELSYHLLHWRTWFTQLLSATEDAKNRMKAAIVKVEKDFGDMFLFGSEAKEIHEMGLIEEGDILQERWLNEINKVYETLNMATPSLQQTVTLNGRNGEHTEEINSAISTLSEVFRMNPTATW